MKFLIFSLITLFVSHISAQSYNISQLGLEQGLLILGVAAWAMGVPDYPAHDWLNAAAVGIVSGWAATGLNQSIKQLTDNK